MGRRIFAALSALVIFAYLPLSALAAPEDGIEDTEAAETVEGVEGDEGIADAEGVEGAVSEGTDIAFSGELDPRTGLPITEGGALPDGAYEAPDGSFHYDADEMRYVNRVGDNTFESNIPNGAILSDDAVVYIDLPAGLGGVLYRNGDIADDVSVEQISGAGSYVIEVRSGNEGASSYFSFVIMPEITASVRELVLPAGFSFEYVYLNDQPVELQYTNSFTTAQDGAYNIAWSCEEIDERFELHFTLDTVAPTIDITGVTNGAASGPVTLSGLEQGAYMLITQGGETLKVSGMDYVLEVPGDYQVTVCDMAGNSTPYAFTIHVYLDISAGAAIALVAAGLAALIIYCGRVRRHPRVG